MLHEVSSFPITIRLFFLKKNIEYSANRTLVPIPSIRRRVVKDLNDFDGSFMASINHCHGLSHFYTDHSMVVKKCVEYRSLK